MIDHPLERAAPGPDALDRLDLALDREDRLDLERRADPGLGAADPPAALLDALTFMRERDPGSAWY